MLCYRTVNVKTFVQIRIRNAREAKTPALRHCRGGVGVAYILRNAVQLAFWVPPKFSKLPGRNLKYGDRRALSHVSTSVSLSLLNTAGHTPARMAIPVSFGRVAWREGKGKGQVVQTPWILYTNSRDFCRNSTRTHEQVTEEFKEGLV